MGRLQGMKQGRCHEAPALSHGGRGQGGWRTELWLALLSPGLSPCITEPEPHPVGAPAFRERPHLRANPYETWGPHSAPSLVSGLQGQLTPWQRSLVPHRWPL